MTSWFTVYSRLTKLLHKFYLEYPEDTAQYFLMQCEENPGFRLLNSWLGRFQRNSDTWGLDPIHIFSSFNDSKLADHTRIRRIEILFNIFGQSLDEHQIDFSGCPTPFMIKIMSTRPVTVQQEIWAFFAMVVKHSSNERSVLDLPSIETWYGINISSLTIFLFWIDHARYIPLDSNTQNLLKKEGFMSKTPKNAVDYFKLLEQDNLPSPLELSVRGQNQRLMGLRSPVEYSGEARIEERVTIRSHHVNLIIPPENSAEPPRALPPIIGCRMVGLRVYDPTPDKWVKVLRRGKMYQFYRAFEFKDESTKYDANNDSTIPYDSFRDINLYHLQSKTVNISAVAGENGAGKSTLLDLVFLAINNLSAKQNKLDNLEYVEGLYLDFFYLTDSLYRISVKGDDVQVVRYKQEAQHFTDARTLALSDFELEQLFYTITINHSLYAMNDLQSGSWLTSLIEKNDQYQIPLVINPYRKNGNIDINKEAELMRTRLLSTLLQPIDDFIEEKYPENLRKLTADKYAQRLQITLNDSVNAEPYRHPKAIVDLTPDFMRNYWRELLREICLQFNIDYPYPPYPPQKPKDFVEAAFMYIVRKVVMICLNYPKFSDYILPKHYQIKVNEIPALVKSLIDDTSHITHKFYQAVHFLTHNHLQEVRDSKELIHVYDYNIADLAFEIDRIRSRSEKKFRVTHFIPPPFLTTEVLLSNDILLSQLSSGEKQRIFSVSSLGYHLINLDSNSGEEALVHYPFINVLFDEIELYFHPEMQRSFVKYLLDYLEVLELETEFKINILFVTHSPFILSDIPSDNILFLGNRVPPGIKTFGANIHTLLAESFFMKDSFMGDFARGKINDLINYLLDEPFKYVWDEQNAAQVISLIGEPLIKERLTEIYRSKYQLDDSKLKRISALENEIQILKNA